MIYKICATSLLEVLDMPNKVQIPVDEKNEWVFQKRPGMMYFVARAVSSGTNGNGDYFSREEITKHYGSFVGKGFFINHQSSDVEKQRGKVIDAKLIDNGTSDGNMFVKCLIEFNEDAYPELGKMIRAGMVNSVSMGCQVGYSTCSICAHAAKTTDQYCNCVKLNKGGYLNGQQVYEINHDIDFQELSLVVKGADSAALILQVLAKQANRENKDIRVLVARAFQDPTYVDSLKVEQEKLRAIFVKSLKRGN